MRTYICAITSLIDTSVVLVREQEKTLSEQRQLNRLVIFTKHPPQSPSAQLAEKLHSLRHESPCLAGRPQTCTSYVPVTLLDESLATFLELCRTGEPTALDRDCAESLTTLSDFFEDETFRMDQFRHILSVSRIVRLERSFIDGTDFKTNGSAFFNIGDTGKRALGVSVQGKLEVGCSGAEPYMESGRYYFEQMRYLNNAGVLKNSYFPSLLLLHFGQCFPQ